MDQTLFLAFDIGAGSGRTILGTFDGCRINLTEIHRFPNEMVYLNGHYCWDVHRLFKELKTALNLSVSRRNAIPLSIGTDTWGVDFGLLDGNGELLGLPFAYRDSLTENAMDEVFTLIDPKDLYARTGIQFLCFNSIFQLWALKKKFPALLIQADKLLFMPDLLNYFFTGTSYSEYTIASTSQILDPYKRNWLPELMLRLGLPVHILEDIIEPGTQVGTVKPEILSELGIPPVSVVAVGAHDTASAIAAIPAEGKNWAFISSGTWSLMGIETDRPVISKDSFQFLFTNEGGVGGNIRFLKNITGLWLLQECKKIWDTEKVLSYDDLIRGCQNAVPFRSLVDPDDPSFLNPGNMPEAIRECCRKSTQPEPVTIPEITRCIFESLAFKYRVVLGQLKQVSPHPIEKIHMIGGGSLNPFLCQLTADATGLPVIAGPAEATALGNILVQISCHFGITSLEILRGFAINSVATVTYLPENQEQWDNIPTTRTAFQ